MKIQNTPELDAVKGFANRLKELRTDSVMAHKEIQCLATNWHSTSARESWLDFLTEAEINEAALSAEGSVNLLSQILDTLQQEIDAFKNNGCEPISEEVDYWEGP